MDQLVERWHSHTDLPIRQCYGFEGKSEPQWSVAPLSFDCFSFMTMQLIEMEIPMSKMLTTRKNR